MNFRIFTGIGATLVAALVVVWQLRPIHDDPPPAPDAAPASPAAPAATPALSMRVASIDSGVASAVQPPEGFELPEVVGEPFALSASVVDACQRLPWLPCDEVDASLEAMRAEPRDDRWARDLEIRIARATLTRADGRYRIRALECRRSRCAIEVASEVDGYDFDRIFDADPAFDDLMFPTKSTFATERDPATGILTQVSVQLWATTEVALAESAARRQ